MTNALRACLISDMAVPFLGRSGLLKVAFAIDPSHLPPALATGQPIRIVFPSILPTSLVRRYGTATAMSSGSRIPPAHSNPLGYDVHRPAVLCHHSLHNLTSADFALRHPLIHRIGLPEITQSGCVMGLRSFLAIVGQRLSNPDRLENSSLF